MQNRKLQINRAYKNLRRRRSKKSAKLDRRTNTRKKYSNIESIVEKFMKRKGQNKQPSSELWWHTVNERSDKTIPNNNRL